MLQWLFTFVISHLFVLFCSTRKRWQKVSLCMHVSTTSILEGQHLRHCPIINSFSCVMKLVANKTLFHLKQPRLVEEVSGQWIFSFIGVKHDAWLKAAEVLIKQPPWLILFLLLLLLLLLWEQQYHVRIMNKTVKDRFFFICLPPEFLPFLGPR